ncbi:MAG: hypothetical protein K2Y29_19100, partial [Beijerinckiaceae bacterium]|nr:hypothetical protein [Beijerinckiaceae bacterium]
KPRAARALFRPALVVAAFAAFGVSGALAQSCNDDIGGFQQKRKAQMEALSKMTKAEGGKLDPIASCPRLRTLAAVEREMLGYMQKNQSWCSIPEQIIEQVKSGADRTAQIAGQACKIAAQASQMRQQQQSQAAPAPALPRGPL